MNKFHNPVLLKDSIMGLNIKPEGVYVDATFGGGGHSKEIINKLTNGKLIGFDQDKDAVKNAFKGDKRFTMINSNFKNLKIELKKLDFDFIDGIIADLGVSSYQFSNNDRGFSFQYNSTIDMRMDRNTLHNGVFVLNHYSRNQLNRIFREHADFKNPTSITKAIIKHREKHMIKTTFDFKNIFKNIIQQKFEHKFFARLFQAIRIEVNDEINALKSFLNQAKDILSPAGRLVVISYHSIEDRVVKRFMKYGNFSDLEQKDLYGNLEKVFRIINKKPIVPSALEVKVNNKARSAKLRICEKL